MQNDSKSIITVIIILFVIVVLVRRHNKNKIIETPVVALPKEKPAQYAASRSQFKRDK